MRRCGYNLIIMLTEFIDQKMRRARYKLLKDGNYFGEIAGVKGVWANAKNLEECREKLQEVLEDWLLLKVRERETIPGFFVRFDRRNLAHA